MDHERKPGNTTSNEHAVLDSISLPSPNVIAPSPGTDDGDTKALGGQHPILPCKCSQKCSHIQMDGNDIGHIYQCTRPQSNSNQATLPVIPKEVLPSGNAVVPADRPTPLISDSDSKTHSTAYLQEPLLLVRTAPSTTLREECEANLDDYLDRTQMLCTESGDLQGTDLAQPSDEEGTRGDFNDLCEDFLPSLPPSSSPPQLFSSSPYVSSQSSTSDTQLPEMVLAADVEDRASSHDCVHDDHVVLVAVDHSHVESENFPNHNPTEAATSLETDDYCSQMVLSSCIEGDLDRKRVTDPDESCGSQLIKRPKLDTGLSPPPAPKRATLTSQHHQFKKLSTPFRPPLKLPTLMNGLDKTVDDGKAESATSAALRTSPNKIDIRGSAVRLQHSASNTSRSTTQFKSPLVNRILPADSRSIRLTPALQTLERRSQLLKRAIKIKEDNEEDVLVKLIEKWIEAGREVAFEVWDAIKDAGDFAGKATFIRRSHGWENGNENQPWGWDIKTGDTSEESCGIDQSEDPCTRGRPDPEEDDNISCNTLGTMLRQLGIIPEIFGWDDDREAFYD